MTCWYIENIEITEFLRDFVGRNVFFKAFLLVKWRRKLKNEVSSGFFQAVLKSFAKSQICSQMFEGARPSSTTADR